MNFNKIVDKATIQIDDIAYRGGNLRAVLQIVFRILSRRGIPLPPGIFEYYNKPSRLKDTAEGGDEFFLAGYMVPKQGKCFVDIGAHIGSWALFVADKGFEVHAFEPSPHAYDALLERAKKYPNMHVYPYAIGDQEAVGSMNLLDFDLGGAIIDEKSAVSPKGHIVSFAIHPLDSLNIANVGTIKIDTEGYEVPILMGARKTILEKKPRLIIEVHRRTGKAMPDFGEELQRIEGILKDLGYSWTVRSRRIGMRELQPFVIADPAN